MAGRGRAYTLFSKCAANRRNDFMFCPECTSEMGEAPSYITRVILFVSVGNSKCAVDTIPLSVSQRFERRIGVTVKSIRVRRRRRRRVAQERQMQFDLRERIRDWE